VGARHVPQATVARLPLYLQVLVEAADGTVLERSLTELTAGGSRVSDRALKDLLDTYEVLTCR
jgi:NADH/NAD ratio-sensing transcriptional regulator Rex